MTWEGHPARRNLTHQPAVLASAAAAAVTVAVRVKVVEVIVTLDTICLHLDFNSAACLSLDIDRKL